MAPQNKPKKIARTNERPEESVVPSVKMQSGGSGASFPPEILAKIFAGFERRDLARVAPVSRRICDAARDLLYTDIHLQDSDRNVESTLALLSKSYIGSRVRSAVLVTTHRQQGLASYNQRPWIAPGLFRKWPKLMSLRFEGIPFFKLGDREQFYSAVRGRCSSLNSFTFVPTGSTEFAGLLDVDWLDSPTTAELELSTAETDDGTFGICSITHISFGGTVIHKARNPVDKVLRHHFPNLSSIKLGSLEECDDIPWSKAVVSQFLARNAKIQHLSLGTTKPTAGVSFQLDHEHIQDGSLPALQSFEGFPEHMSALAQAEVHSLDNIVRLSLSFTRDDLEDMTDHISHLASSGLKLPSVQRLHVDLYPKSLDHRSPTNFAFIAHGELLPELARICYAATEVSAKLPPLNGGSLLAQYFGDFKHLEELILPYMSLHTYMRVDGELEYLMPLSSRCPKLRVMAARRLAAQGPDKVYTLERDKSQALVRVIVAEV